MLVRELDYTTEADLFGSLRFDVFVKKLGWIRGDPVRQVELNHLDVDAHHIGVFDDSNTLVGYVRVIQGDALGSLLLEEPEFSPLFPYQGLWIDQTIGEVSRFCVRPGRPSNAVPSDQEVARLLIRAVYDLAVSKRILKMYATTNDSGGYINKQILEKLSFVVLTGPHQFARGVDTYLMVVDVPGMATVPFVRKYLSL